MEAFVKSFMVLSNYSVTCFKDPLSSPFLAQRYLAQPRVLSVCASLCLIAQPFLDNIQSYAPITSHDFLY